MLCSLVNDILDAASLRNNALRLVEGNVILSEVSTTVHEFASVAFSVERCISRYLTGKVVTFLPQEDEIDSL